MNNGSDATVVESEGDAQPKFTENDNTKALLSKSSQSVAVMFDQDVLELLGNMLDGATFSAAGVDLMDIAEKVGRARNQIGQGIQSILDAQG